jgi:hypothetical protein
MGSEITSNGQRDEMPTPCEQKSVIEDIWEAVSDVKEDQKRGLSELKLDIKELVGEFREVTREMRDILMDGREIKTRLSNDEKDIDILFKEAREFRLSADQEHKEIKAMVARHETWINKEDGARGIFEYGLPIICTVITTIIAIAAWAGAFRSSGVTVP